jgi:membrane protein implicated in regulation of membrane protease activity
MVDFKKLISKDYLFAINRVALTRSDKMFLWLGVGAAVVGIVLWLIKFYVSNPVDKKFLNKLAKIISATGLLEILWFGARYENVMFFGTHFVAIVILLGSVALTIWTAVKYLRNRKIETGTWQKEQVKQKYLNQ